MFSDLLLTMRREKWSGFSELAKNFGDVTRALQSLVLSRSVLLVPVNWSVRRTIVVRAPYVVQPGLLKSVTPMLLHMEEPPLWMSHCDHMLDAWLYSIGFLPRNFESDLLRENHAFYTYVHDYEYAFGKWCGNLLGLNMTQVYSYRRHDIWNVTRNCIEGGGGGILTIWSLKLI